MVDLAAEEQRAIGRLRMYRDLAHMEIRDRAFSQVRRWRDGARSTIATIRLFRSVR